MASLPATSGTRVAPNARMIRHHFTVDVEESFQVSAFESTVRRCDWSRFESRLTGSVSRLLDLLARHEARGTFFVVGWVAERHPDLVRRIARAGHEVASHSWDHARVTDQSPSAFRDSVRRAEVVRAGPRRAPGLGGRRPRASAPQRGGGGLLARC